ncbi:MAG: hypothetical protein R3F07_13480 [Opitutaceae bacterium]
MKCCGIIPRLLPIAWIAVLWISPANARQELSPTYTATVVEREFKGVEDIEPKEMAGIWLLQFLPGNAFVLLKDGEIMVDGYWTLKDDLLTLTRMTGPLVCSWDDAEKATYRVDIQGFSVAFRATEDVCEGRAAVLTRGTFRTVPR